MRAPAWFLLLVVVVVPVCLPVWAPVSAWAGPLDSARPKAGLAADPAALCETAIDSAEYAGGLPPRLLGAIG